MNAAREVGAGEGRADRAGLEQRVHERVELGRGHPEVVLWLAWLAASSRPSRSASPARSAAAASSTRPFLQTMRAGQRVVGHLVEPRSGEATTAPAGGLRPRTRPGARRTREMRSVRGSAVTAADRRQPGGSRTGSTVFARQSSRSVASASPNTEASLSMSPTGTPWSAPAPPPVRMVGVVLSWRRRPSASTRAWHSAALDASPVPGGTLDDTTSSTPAPGAPCAAAAATKRPHVGSTPVGLGGCPDQDTVPVDVERAGDEPRRCPSSGPRPGRPGRWRPGRQNPPV